ncbi:MAG: DNA polymerase III subunit beta [Deltaproteobacteria bacterium]|jgi:DNA polymerase-3 subunit beta|nr:DNA polymerase III subunit beta [Deltaproteobacteria bacterium]
MLHIRVKTEDLKKSIAQTSSVADKRTTMPILNNVLVHTENDQLVVTATDLETTFQANYPAEIFEEGRIAIPAKTFSTVIGACVSEHIEIKETDNHSMDLSSGSFKLTLFGLSPTNFPKIPEFSDVALTQIESKDLLDAVNKVGFSMSTTDHVYTLNGVNLLKEGGDLSEPELKFVSTDSQRLNVCALTGIALNDLNIEPTGIIIPSKGVQELKNLAESSEFISIGVSSNHFIAKSDRATLQIRLKDGAFPDYKPIIPKENDQIVWLDRKEFISCLKRVNIVTHPKNPEARFVFSNNLLTITVTNPELGQAQECMNVDYTGEEITTAFNPVFLLEVAGAMKSERIAIASKPDVATYLITGPEDPSYNAVVVSMTISQE